MDDELNLNELESLANEQIIKKLTSIKGIGVWTSKMYLIFVLSREDVLPVEDKAFKNSFKKIYTITEENEYETKIEEYKNVWHPYESIAAWYIWASHRT